MTEAYAELGALSNFTFLEGASHPHELALTAKALGHAALRSHVHNGTRALG